MELLENEKVDDLQYKGLKLIQKTDGFRFGVDAVLLAHFADVKKGSDVLDLGTGTGIIPVLLAGKTEARSITGLEIQQEMVEMASRSVALNDLGDRVRMVCGDLKNAVELFGPSRFQTIVTNPPYMNRGAGLLNPSDSKAVSRHELLCTLEDVIRVSSRLLVPGGQFAMVHRPERLADIIYLMRSCALEPKYLQLVHPAPYKEPNLLLIKGSRQGRPGLKMMKPLYVYDENGHYSVDINRIYCREQEER